MPRSTAATLLVALAICTAAAGVSAQSHELHGSGTTNPSKFFWKVMDLMEERSRTPVTMTYRAVGTSRARAREPARARSRRGGVAAPRARAERRAFRLGRGAVARRGLAPSLLHGAPPHDVLQPRAARRRVVPARTGDARERRGGALARAKPAR